MAGHLTPLAAGKQCRQESVPSTSTPASQLPLAMSALSVAPAEPLLAAAAAGCCTANTTLDSLPVEILALIHGCVLQSDPTLRSCFALEATCTHLQRVFRSSTRFPQVLVLPTAQNCRSFWKWIAVHGWRTDLLLLQNLELRRSTPKLRSLAGVLQASAVHVQAAAIDTLEPLRELVNLAAVEYCGPRLDGSAVRLEPLAGLPVLEHVVLQSATSDTQSLAALSRMSGALTRLSLHSDFATNLDHLQSFRKLKELQLRGWYGVATLAPLSCLISLTRLELYEFCWVQNLVPLAALSRLQHLEVAVATDRSFSIEPLCQLPLLTQLNLLGSRHVKPGYNLQPLSSSVLAKTLRSFSVVGCQIQPGFQLAPMVQPVGALDCPGNVRRHSS
jgi:hypothetical protein